MIPLRNIDWRQVPTKLGVGKRGEEDERISLRAEHVTEYGAARQRPPYPCLEGEEGEVEWSCIESRLTLRR